MNSLLFPLSRYKILTPLLILLSALLIVGQSLLTDGNAYILWSNWVAAGVCALGIWYVMGRFHLGGVSEGKTFTIVWPLMSISLNYAYLYFDPTFPFYRGLLQQFALLGVITLVLSTWQEVQSSLRNMGIGMLVGLSATFFPHTILWLLLVPFFTFHMRSTNARNVFSIITGMFLGVWIDYCLLFVWQGSQAADAMLLNFSEIFNAADYLDTFLTYSLWQWLYLALLVLLVVVYSISAMLLGTGHSMRASASIVLLSTMSIAEVLFLFLDIHHSSLHIGQLAMFLCIQLSVHQANLRSSANEWWTLFIYVSSLTISILPLVYEYL